MFSQPRSAPPDLSGPSGAPVYGPLAPTAPGRLWRLLRGPIDEIANDGVLRAYGAVLVLTHVLTAAFWWREGIATLINRGAEPICWSLVPNCGPLRILSTGQVEWMLIGYAVVALLIAPLFVSRRLTPAGYVGLIALTLFKVIVLAMDFRLRRNQHYMAFWVSGAFLFLPAKRETLRLLLVLFYFWAGTIKLNWEWISGAGLYRPLWILTGKTAVIAACTYVIVMELIISWGVLSARRWIFWGALAQLALFHFMSWPVVGFFYPVLMFMLLTIFVLDRMAPSPISRADLLKPFFTGGARWGTYAVALIFSLFQLYPYTFPGDRAITGEGRVFALHMFDARVTCRNFATVTDDMGNVREINLRPGLPPRMNCDPLVAYHRARNLCENRSPLASGVVDLDLRIDSRRTSESALREVVNVTDFCSRDLRYQPLRHNAWIRVD